MKYLLICLNNVLLELHLTLFDLHDKIYFVYYIVDWRLNAMLKLVSSGTHSEREELFINLIKQASDSDMDILVIIPDQFSFE